MALGNDDGYLRTAQGTQIVHLCPGIPSLIIAYVGAETPQHFFLFPLRPRPAFIVSWAHSIHDFIENHSERMCMIAERRLSLTNRSTAQQVFSRFEKELILSFPANVFKLFFPQLSDDDVTRLFLSPVGFGL